MSTRSASRARIAVAFVIAAIGPIARAARAQATAQSPSSQTAPMPTAPEVLARAFDLEATRPREAAVAFRRALVLAQAARDRDVHDAALLGLERVWVEAGHPDSVLALAAEIARTSPPDAVAHAVALRTLVTLGRDTAARAEFDQWRRAAPDEAAPYAEFVRVLLDAGRTSLADTVLAEAARAPLSRRARQVLLPARARALAADRAWGDAAHVWRDVLAEDAVYGDAVVFALRPAPDSARDAVVGALVPAGPGVARTPATDSGDVAARGAAAALLVAWHRATAAWAIAEPLPPDAASRELWRAIAAELDAGGSRGAASSAWTRVLDSSPRGSGDAREAFLRAADDALQAGDPAQTLALLDRGRESSDGRDSTSASLRVLRVQALAALGRVDEAERVAAASPAPPGSALAAAGADALAAAWIARGDVSRAAAALRRVGADSGEAAGWLALATGDLRRARAIFAHAPPSVDLRRGLLPDVRVAARAALARSRGDSAPDLGAALIAAARGDAPGAVTALERAARALPDARAPLIAAAADAAAGAGDRARAAALWGQLLADAADAPEAPAAELAWARALLAAGDRPRARAHLEHLIFGYPDSALVPIARRELDRLGSA